MSSRMRPQASASSLAPSSATSGGASSAAAETANATALAGVFRTLVFGGSVPIQFVIAGEDIPSGGNVDEFYVQAPRISYLPLIIPHIRKYFLNLALDDNTAASLREEDIWFEAEGMPLKWHWPIGLLYDYHLASRQSSLFPAQTSYVATPTSTTLPTSLSDVFAPLSAPSSAAASPNLSFPGSLPPLSQPLDSQSTLRAARPRTPSSIRSGASMPPTFPLVGETSQPWRVVVHLREPPTSELVVSNRIEDTRTGFMAMVKEADYVRWGSTKRTTNLRKEQQDALWDGVVQNNFEKYWAVASRLVPLPSLSSNSAIPSATRSPTPSSGSSEGRPPDANTVRSVPIRIFLPDGAPVVQELVPPMQADGSPTTLAHFLSTVLPVLFPPSSSNPPLAHPLIQGIVPPLAAQLGWIGACLAGADGFVNVVLALDERDGGHERERSY